MPQKFAENNELLIEYIHVNEDAANIPLVIVPGAIVGAGDVYEEIKNYIRLNTIFISIRGRGESSKPETGYSLDEQVSDIECVVSNEKLDEFYLMGHSNGAGIASCYTLKYPGKVKGLILADYAPGYPKLTNEWAARVRENVPDINDNLLNGLVNDSVKQYFLDALAEIDVKVLLLKAGGEDSLLQAELAEKIRSKLKNCELKEIHDCSHEMFADKPEEVLTLVEEFMRS